MNRMDKTPPVQPGDRLEVELVNEGKKPMTMVARVSGYIIFVQNCGYTTGDKVMVEIEKTLPNFGFAKLAE